MRHVVLQFYNLKRNVEPRGLSLLELKAVKATQAIVRDLPARTIPFSLGEQGRCIVYADALFLMKGNKYHAAEASLLDLSDIQKGMSANGWGITVEPPSLGKLGLEGIGSIAYAKAS